jgi:aminoglycoside/choline kinase family phosphotransferase
MSEPVISTPPASWLKSSIGGTWAASRPGRIVQLKGDASTRRFWRVWIEDRAADAPASAIAVDLGPEMLPAYARVLKLYREPLEEPPYLNVHRFMESIGSPVPMLYGADIREGLLLVEDVGDKSLFDAATTDPARCADLYRLAIDELIRLHIDGTKHGDERCYAFGVRYDERLFRWELKQFEEMGLDQIAPGMDSGALERELGDLAERLGQLPRVFSHRDYHARNLFLQAGRDGGLRLRIIDFQDALMAPAAQDLALLLTTRDTARAITPAIEARLLDYYQAGLFRRRASNMDAEQFLESYRLCVLQHALKMIGRFVWLERQGKSGYAAYLPHAAAQARRMLATPTMRRFARLKRAFEVA